MAMSQQDCFLYLVCWSGVQRDKVAQRAGSSQDVSSLNGVQIIPGAAALVMWAQASPHLGSIITSSQFRGQRAGI